MNVDGNAEQVRAVADHLAESLYRKLHDDLVSEDRIDEKIVHALTELETRVNRKLLAAIFANAIPMIAAAFFMGMLWSKFSDVPEMIVADRAWMALMEARVNQLEVWAEDRPSEPYRGPRPSTIPR